MKHSLHFLLLLLASSLLCACGNNTDQSTMDSDSTSMQPSSVIIDNSAVNGLIIYYPQFSHIDLVCGKMPSQQDTSVIFCAEAAFTHELLDEFAHSNIDGDHVSGGKRYKGARCEDNSGAFAWFADTTWEFVHGEYDELLDSVAQAGGMGFGQAIIIHEGESIRPLWRENKENKVTHFRALCEKDGKLCIVDSRDEVEYATFVTMLEKFAPRHALYMDMGAGWNHSWWRDDQGQVHEIHPATDKSHYCTNWITFYKK